MRVRELLKLCLQHIEDGDLDAEVLVEVRGTVLPTWGIRFGEFPDPPPKVGKKWLTIKGTEAWGLDGRIFVGKDDPR